MDIDNPANTVPAPVSTAVRDLTPTISNDWQTLYFSSTVGGNPDIWDATL
jgi:hypothetical protein